MAVSEQTPHIEYTANGTTTSFALEFYCEKKEHLIVLVDDVEPVVGTWSLTGGAVVFNTAPENGKKITIQRNTPFSRNTDYQSYNNSFRPQSVNGDFDRVWLKLQELGLSNWLLKNYVDRKDDELKSFLMAAIQAQGIALDQLEEYYNYLMQRLAQIAVDKGWDASFVVDGDKTQKQINIDVESALNGRYTKAETYSKPEIDTSLTAIAGGHKAYQTLAAAQAVQASFPANSIIEVTNDGANNGTYQWNGTTLTKSAFDPLTQAKAYSDANAIFKPLFNPTEKNLNNVPYGVHYYNVSGDITLANNFPVAGSPSYVLTYAVTGSSVKYQRAILPFFNPIRIFDRLYTGSWSAWTETVTQAQVSANVSAIAANASAITNLDSKVFSQIGKNLLDKSKIVDGEYLSLANSKILTSANYKRSGFIPVVEGQQYYLSGTSSAGTIIGWYATADKTANALSVTNARTGVAPAGAKYAIVNITGDGTTTYNDTAQFEVGNTATTYEAYKTYIDLANVYGSDGFLTDTEILYYDSFNKVDPSKVNFTKRYSTSSKAMIAADANLIAASDYILVAEGEWYTVSGTAIYGLPSAGNCQGGYFSAAGTSTAVDNISFVAPVTGEGACFKVPTGLGITHVVISLDKTAGNALDGTAQLESGEMPTTYQAYNLKPYIKTALLPVQSGNSSSATLDDSAWFKYTKADSPTIYPDKLPNFRKHMLLKDKDVCVVMTGTSLTARTSEHCTLRTDANLRPPMMHSNAFCSHVWDALKWEGQQYRRYDAGYFTETGTFATASNLAEWDDGAYRDGLTRYSEDAAAVVQFTIPIDAWQFNFIYRTDSLGCEAKLVIAGGVGLVQVYDEATATWVEANNYVFSMLEAAPVTRTVAIPSVILETTSNYTLASKGNTTYQKRLKMRCRSTDGSIDSRASAKTVTISNNSGSGRFMYWGVEWSPRQFMVTYINSSRGSHNTSATGTTGLPRFQDNEVWSFKPDLILSELAIHNDGAAAAGVYPVGQWKQLAKHYVTNLSYELSLYSRAAFFNLTPEYAFFMGSITWNFGGINDDGSLKYDLQTSSAFGSAKAMSALDKYQEAVQYLREQNIVCLDTAQRWVEAGNALFGDLKTATLGSGKGGATFTNKGSHWNDTGGKIMAKAVIPLLK